VRTLKRIKGLNENKYFIENKGTAKMITLLKKGIDENTYFIKKKGSTKTTGGDTS
jgi:hypothetical protein